MPGTEDLAVNEGKDQQEGRKDTNDHEKAQNQEEHREVAQNQKERVQCHPGFFTWLGPQGQGVFGLADRRNTVQYQGCASSVEHEGKMARGEVFPSKFNGSGNGGRPDLRSETFIYIYI